GANGNVPAVRQAGGTASPGFELVHDYDVSSVVASGDSLISALPDWDGRIWFASKQGIAGTINRKSGRVRSRNTGEPIGNSFAVDDTGGLSIVTDQAMYRFDAVHGRRLVTWRRRYPNIGVVKPRQTEKRSG